jgi:murein DD-endopeptidase MepM/ murein hydrolase activator NlpD
MRREWTSRAPRRWPILHVALVTLLLTVTVVHAGSRPVAAFAQEPEFPAFSYPIGDPGQPLGDGFVIRHGYATENTWYLPGYLHAGEDWYRIEGDTAGASVYAIGAGEVVFAGSDYPGRVVIIQHEDDLFSMYGHLDPDLSVVDGDRTERGQLIGTVATRGDDVPNHLHFELRTFLTTSEVNGDTPSYDFGCGIECPPGPGYWPIDAPDHPSDVGWRNPTHAIAAETAGASDLEVVISAEPPEDELQLRADPTDDADVVQSITAEPGSRFPLVDVRADQADTDGTSAEAYSVWYRIQPERGEPGWVRAVVASTMDTGADNRPSSLRFVLLPAIEGADSSPDD